MTRRSKSTENQPLKAPSKKKLAASTPPTPPTPRAKTVRHCATCSGQVALKARYCRHCGVALSPEVPANPFLPTPPKPWRPSRIPKPRPEELGVAAAHEPQAPMTTEAQVVEKASPPPPPPPPPQVWDPVPQIELRMAELAQLNERVKPRLVRAEMVKRRLPKP